MRLAADEHAAGQARRYARHWLADQSLSPRLVDDIELVVAELVSNAVRHGAPPYDVELHQAAGVIRGEVRDRSSALPRLNRAPDHNGGFGLGIVAACTARWGAVADADGKEVWFEIDP